MTAQDPSYRSLIQRIAVLVAIMISGAALSAIVIQPTALKAATLICTTAMAIALVPRYWVRWLAFIFFMAACFGVAVIASDYGHHVIYDTPLPRSTNDYIWQTTASCLFAAVWLSWWLWSHRFAKHANVDT